MNAIYNHPIDLNIKFLFKKITINVLLNIFIDHGRVNKNYFAYFLYNEKLLPFLKRVMIEN